ncbi:hypothetical protein GDO86_013587 [Hymenochirus boettgeri]|uniref:Olfactory receptor n=1 Tax=Hymenochirus boettgeri TaxID=247094 RepID=A0A8T2IX97_9PIPI|nr:hypothetical protein GDO86_018047 [Hymenochirus boettgeri]KAG8435704.1 hypothetical protein GDO86_013587 [Hymenochirus boettgeri]
MSGNQSKLTSFTVLCFTEEKYLQIPLFILFLLIYLIIILGNTTVFTTISLSPKLHTPMYMFLGNLSFLDISYTSTTFPKLLHMVYTQQKTISFTGCITQLYVLGAFGCTEGIVLAIMAYDRYMAICQPFRYALLMSLKHCARFIAGVWAVGLLDPVPIVLLTANLLFCSSHHIDHFYCDIIPLLKITCSDTSTIEILIYMNGVIMFFITMALTSISYVFIICTILKIQTSQGRQKAFSTCTSHLTCVTIFYGTITCSYLRPTKSYNPVQDSCFALLYIALVPLLNPFIYTLKNKEFKDNLKKIGIRIY